MKTSTDFQTGSILLLVATVICGGLAVSVLAPLLHRDTYPPAAAAVMVEDRIVVEQRAEKFSEFFPTIADAESQLQRLKTITGPAPARSPQPRLVRNTVSNTEALPRHDNRNSSRTPIPVAEQNLSQLETPDLDPGQAESQGFAAPFPAPAFRPTNVVAQIPRSTSQTDFGAGSPAAEPAVVSNPAIPYQQIPSGGVYVPVTVHPVTVNVDGSAYAQQLDALTERFDRLLSKERESAIATAAATASTDVAETKRFAKERNRSRQPRNQKSPRNDEQIVRLEKNVQDLVQSFRSLQEETQSELKQLSVQADRVEIANQVIESYELLLEESRANREVAPSTRVAVAPEETYSDSPTLPSSIPQKIREFGPTPVPVVEEEQIPPEVATEDPELLPPFDFESESHSDGVPYPKTPESDFELLAPERVERSEPVPTPEILLTPVTISADAVVRQPQNAAAPTRVFPTVEVIDEPQIEAPMRMILPQPFESVTPPGNSSSPAVETPTATFSNRVQRPTARLIPVPNSIGPETVTAFHPEPMPAPPVGYEHVYRFTLADVEANPADGAAHGPVCEKCGQVHTTTDQHIDGRNAHPHGTVKLTAAFLKPTDSSQGPEAANQSAPQAKSSSSAARNNRNAARGTNRHVRNSVETDGDRSVWDVELPSFERNASKPGLLQRVGSTLKHLGRSSTVE